MSRWIVLSLSDIEDHKVADLVTALRSEALAEGQGDPMPGMIADTAAEIRGAIAFSGRYKVDANLEAIPKSLRNMAAKKVIREMKGRLEIQLNKDDEADADIYEKRLKALTENKWPIDKPDVELNPAPTQTVSTGVAIINPKPRQTTRQKMDGI